MDYNDSELTADNLSDTRDEQLASLMEQLMMGCLAEQLAYRMHHHLRQYNELRSRLVTLPDSEAEKYGRYATTNPLRPLVSSR